MNSRMEMWNEMDAKKLAEEFELGERYVQGGREVELLIAKALRAFGKPPEAAPRDIAQELIAGLEEVRDMRKCKKCTAPHCFCEGGAGEETIAVPREMFQAAMCSVNRDRWTSNREGLEGSAQAMKELHDQMSDLWMASSSQPQICEQGK